MDYRQLSRFLAAGRASIGVVALVAPGAGLRAIGVEASGGAKLITRAFAGRELALGLGTLRSLDHQRHSDDWVRAGAAADVVDATAVVLASRSLGLLRTIVGATIAAGAAVVGLRAADRLD
ncbi:MAG: hypothetical protein ACR2QE_08915 [Acidimicrobiales bacterium]